MNAPVLCRLESNELFAQNLPLVRAIAMSIRRRLPPQVEFDDITQAGAMGLLDAIKKYDPAKMVPFSVYARFRIRGAILDSLRNLDELSRNERHRVKQTGDCPPEGNGDSPRTGKEEKPDKRAWFTMVRSSVRVATGSNRDAADSGDPTIDPKAPPEGSPDWRCERSMARKVLGETIGTLPPRYQRLISLYYDGNMTMREIGKELGINESRVSQMHRTALDKMAFCLAARGVESSRMLITT